MSTEKEATAAEVVETDQQPADNTVVRLEKKPKFSKEAFGLRLDQNFADLAGVQRVINIVPVRKPGRQEFFRVRSGEEWNMRTPVLDLKEEREIYLVAPALWTDLQEEIKEVCIFTAINRAGGVFLWPARMPSGGRGDTWAESAIDAAQRAQTRWHRMVADMKSGVYALYEAPANLSEPEWPAPSFNELLDMAFKDTYIDDFNHPVLKRLRGEV